MTIATGVMQRVLNEESIVCYVRKGCFIRSWVYIDSEVLKHREQNSFPLRLDLHKSPWRGRLSLSRVQRGTVSGAFSGVSKSSS